MNKIIKVGITQGDINGISYEVILKSFDDNRIFELMTPILYGSSKILAYYRKLLDLPPINTNTISQANEAGNNRLNIINCAGEDVNVELSQSTQEAEQFAKEAMKKALEDMERGAIDVLVTTPSSINEFSYLNEQIQKDEKFLKILVNDSLRIALATDKLPLTEVSSSLDKKIIAEQIRILHASLINDFMVTTPRIAVLSFNPGAGIKEQQFGKEETEVIVPAIQGIKDAGIICFGPYAADEFFGSNEYQRFDAVLAIYHDQGLIPFRTISAGKGTTYIANSTYVITSPDHNVAYEKAGKNQLSGDSLRDALYMAIDILRNRRFNAESKANPLKKQYFERGSDNEKLDLTRDE